MAYYVRLLSPSEKVIPFSEIVKQGNSIKLVSGTDIAWLKMEIYEPAYALISVLERDLITPGSLGENTLAKLRESIDNSYPINAREWVKNYLPKVKTIFSFHLISKDIVKEGWLTLGRIQNLLKDTLGGIIQADNEGFYNEDGDYILWQMYEGANGTIPAAILDDKGVWIPYQLKLNNKNAIERFKQGILPERGFLGKLLGR